MAVLLPRIGVTSCTISYALLQEYPQNIVGSFWVMCGYGLEDKKIPNWWIDNVLRAKNFNTVHCLTHDSLPSAVA